MSETKHRRSSKKQLGQFMTPPALASSLVDRLSICKTTKVLEPSFGDGSFIIPLIERFMPLYDGLISERLANILTNNVFGVEIDTSLYERCLSRIEDRWGPLPDKHNLVCADFFRCSLLSGRVQNNSVVSSLLSQEASFDIITGNPPFGGTIDLSIQDILDKAYGFRNGDKIKKETYAFFLVKSLEHLKRNGNLLFICSDTLMTISTMRGLRKLLMAECEVHIDELKEFSEETSYPMVLVELVRSGWSESISVSGRHIDRSTMALTGNFSWAITENYSKYFAGPKLGEYVICSSGMTIGRNDLFVREIIEGKITEPYDFEFFDDPVILEKELQKARLHKLSTRMIEKITLQEMTHTTRRNVRVVPKSAPLLVELPNPDYRFYNKATSAMLYSQPTHAIYWRDDGDAVLTFKKNGNWYLHGVGGKPYFGRSGLTWQLIAQRLNVRYLPEGYILDSGAPCAFLRPKVHPDELLFILGWTCTELATSLLKTVINHTMNIQGKDFERLPYPYWVDSADKKAAIALIRALIERGMQGVRISRSSPEMLSLETLYSHKATNFVQPSAKYQQLALWEGTF